MPFLFIDDTQVGLTNLHQDINYQVGRIATQSAILQMPFSGWRQLLRPRQPHVFRKQRL